MNIYTLILIFASGAGHIDTTMVGEYRGLESCKSAAEEVREQTEDQGFGRAFSYVCVPQND